MPAIQPQLPRFNILLGLYIALHCIATFYETRSKRSNKFALPAKVKVRYDSRVVRWMSGKMQLSSCATPVVEPDIQDDIQDDIKDDIQDDIQDDTQEDT